MQRILTPLQIEQKINRIAHQIMEFNFDNDKVFIVGIESNGLLLANKIGEVLKKSFNKDIFIHSIALNKDEPLSDEIVLSVDGNIFRKKNIVLVDDVINSGKTMQYALIKLLEFEPNCIKTVALVERSYRRYPITCDFVGLSLSTTLKNHVEITIDKNNFSAFLV